MMDTEIFNINASWAEKFTKTRVPFLSAPTVTNINFTSHSSALKKLQKQFLLCHLWGQYLKLKMKYIIHDTMPAPENT